MTFTEIQELPTTDTPVDAEIARLFERLDEMIEQTWRQVESSPLWQHVAANGFDRELYSDLMVQIFHYTRHNSVNQALTVAATEPEERALLRFVFGHADDELGHEQLVVHDLRAVGLIADEDLRSFARVPATDALIRYLTGLAVTDGAVPRLGYSYWAENVYSHLAPLLEAARRSLALTDRQMTFFVAHSDIDVEHSAEVRRIITKVATTPERRQAIFDAAATTLWLTTELMSQTFTRWKER